MTPSKPWKSSLFSLKTIRKFANFAIYIMIGEKSSQKYYDKSTNSAIAHVTPLGAGFVDIFIWPNTL